MFENIIVGPICCYMDDNHCGQIIRDLVYQNWIPLYRLTKGDWLEGFKQQMPPEQAKVTAGLITTIGFRKLYEA